MPRALTSHHLLKALALVGMTLDHIGAFFFPDLLWLRVAGRVTVPIWFFLIGQSPSYRVGGDLILWAGVLLLLNPLLGGALFPSNVLVTIILCRLVLTQVEKRGLFRKEPLSLLVASLVLLPLFFLMEYGTLGFLFALLGYVLREGRLATWQGRMVAVMAPLLYLLVETHVLTYSTAQLIVMVVGLGVVMLFFLRFRYRAVTLPRRLCWATSGLWFISHYSMQYYVIHRVLFQAMAVLLGLRVVAPALFPSF